MSNDLEVKKDDFGDLKRVSLSDCTFQIEHLSLGNCRIRLVDDNGRRHYLNLYSRSEIIISVETPVKHEEEHS